MNHKVEKIDFEDDYILLKVNGKKYRIDLNKQSKKLLRSNDNVKRNYIISPSGYGIHWPDIDEDLSIDGLIRASSRRRMKTKARKVQSNQS